MFILKFDYQLIHKLFTGMQQGYVQLHKSTRLLQNCNEDKKDMWLCEFVWTMTHGYISYEIKHFFFFLRIWFPDVSRFFGLFHSIKTTSQT